MASSLSVSAAARAPGQAHGQAKRHRTGTEKRIDPPALARWVIPRGTSHEPTVPACPCKPRRAAGARYPAAAGRPAERRATCWPHAPQA